HLAFEPFFPTRSTVAPEAVSVAWGRGIEPRRATVARGGAPAGGGRPPRPAGARREAPRRLVRHRGQAPGARARRRVQRDSRAQTGAPQPADAGGRGLGRGGGGGDAEHGRQRRACRVHAQLGWAGGAVGRTLITADSGALAGYTLTAAGPVVIEDLAAEIRFSVPPHLEAHDIVSGVCVVVQGRERPWGVLGAYSAQPREFSGPDVLFVQALAHVLATALERARVEEALRKSEEHFRSLTDNASA